MKKIFVKAIWPLFLLPYSLLAQLPGGIENESLWLKGNFASDAAQAATLNFNPALSVANYRTILKIPGSINYMRRTTIFTVYQISGAQQEKKLWQITGHLGDLSLSSNQVSSNSNKTNLYFKKNTPASIQKSGAVINTYLGRRKVENGDFDDENKNHLIQFGQPDSQVSGKATSGSISELILYERILTQEEITKIETYLALKYGITLEKNYVSSLGETLWNWEKDNIYCNNIAGIGRDDRASLYQKQGTSYDNNEELVIGSGSIKATNDENNSQLNDRNYLVWGDNAANTNTNTEIAWSKKTWLMRVTGNGANQLSTELKVNAKKLFETNHSPKDLYLVIDNCGAGDFISQHCAWLLPDSVAADGNSFFKNIFWDADGSGQDHFRFALRQTDADRPEINHSKIISFRVYPSPTSDGQYRVEVLLSKATDAQIFIYDMNGKLIDSQKGSAQTSYSFCGNLNGPAGTYTVKLLLAGAEFSKIIILR